MANTRCFNYLEHFDMSRKYLTPPASNRSRAIIKLCMVFTFDFVFHFASISSTKPGKSFGNRNKLCSTSVKLNPSSIPNCSGQFPIWIDRSFKCWSLGIS